MPEVIYNEARYSYTINTPIWFMHKGELCCSPVRSVKINVADTEDTDEPSITVTYTVWVAGDNGQETRLTLYESEVSRSHDVITKRLRDNARIHPTLGNQNGVRSAPIVIERAR